MQIALKNAQFKGERPLEKYVDKALEFEDYSYITASGMDETSRAKGHN